jgi:radical SAM protein with 4Fe4S-binding SPASM domain
MIRIFDRWLHDDSIVTAHNIEQWVESIISGKKSSCNYLISVGPNGDLYLCGRVHGIKELCYGNINEKSIDEIMKSEEVSGMMERRAREFVECHPCEWKPNCYGGCFHHAYINYGTIYKLDPYCQSRKKILGHMASAIGNQLKKAEIKQ